MSLSGAVDVLTDSERARHPGSLALQAYFDGWNQAIGRSPTTFPRYLDQREEREWRLGWADGKKAPQPPKPEAQETEPTEPTEEEADEAAREILAQFDELDNEPSAAAPAAAAPDGSYPPVDGSQPCAQTDPEAWFPEKGGSPRAAKRLCGTCAFEDACLEYALRHKVTGVWGGTTEGQRNRLRRQRGIVPAPVQIPDLLPAFEQAA